MTASVQSQVVAAAVAALDGVGGAQAYRCRMKPFPAAQLPAFNVLPDEGSSLYLEAAAIDRRFRFKVRHMAQAVDEVDATVDPLYVAGQKALLADPTLGGLVRYTREMEQKWERDGQGEYDNCALVVTYEVEFATSRSDPSSQVP